jgi:hypothetical protein
MWGNITYIHTHGFPLYMTTPNHLSLWEELEVNKQIQALVFLRKMCPNNLEYATCKMTLPIKKDKSKCFCGDYTPLNLQIWKYVFLTPLINDILNQLGQSEYYFA